MYGRGIRHADRPSGCGKSTLLNILAGVLTPESGEVFVDGTPVHGVSSRFAYMPQNDLLLPWKTILDNVTLYGRLYGQKKQTQRPRSRNSRYSACRAMSMLYPDELSGGMRQRAAFLRTALCSADIMLLDEPFGALDVITRNEMQDWLLRCVPNLDAPPCWSPTTSTRRCISPAALSFSVVDQLRSP